MLGIKSYVVPNAPTDISDCKTLARQIFLRIPPPSSAKPDIRGFCDLFTSAEGVKLELVEQKKVDAVISGSGNRFPIMHLLFNYNSEIDFSQFFTEIETEFNLIAINSINLTRMKWM